MKKVVRNYLAVEAPRWEKLACFHALLVRQLDLVAHRSVLEAPIPAHENKFSRFEPHTEWIQKGKPPHHPSQSLNDPDRFK